MTEMRGRHTAVVACYALLLAIVIVPSILNLDAVGEVFVPRLSVSYCVTTARVFGDVLITAFCMSLTVLWIAYVRSVNAATRKRYRNLMNQKLWWNLLTIWNLPGAGELPARYHRIQWRRTSGNRVWVRVCVGIASLVLGSLSVFSYFLLKRLSTDEASFGVLGAIETPVLVVLFAFYVVSHLVLLAWVWDAVVLSISRNGPAAQRGTGTK